MSGKEKITNLTVQAVRPVSYVGGLIQMVGRILFGGAAVIAVVVAASMALTYMFSGRIPQNIMSPKIEEGGATLDYVAIAGNPKSENKLMVLDLTGLILGAPPFPDQDPYFYAMFDVTFGYQLRNQILRAAGDDSIKGILIHTRTPGGTIHGSLAIHDAIALYQEKTKKPVAVWVEGISASGGVYSTAPATAIYAAPGSRVGSIGVIGRPVVYYNDPIAIDGGMAGGGITTRGGIEVEYMHAGRGKDGGNPYRKATEEELAIEQESLDALYQNFVDVVATARGIEADKIITDLGAHVYGNERAEQIGLIDATLSLDEAYGALAMLANIEGNDFTIVRRRPQRASYLELLLADNNNSGESEASLVEQVLPLLEREKCAATERFPMAYHGSMNSVCATLP